MDAEAYRWIQMTTDAPSDMIRMQNSNQAKMRILRILWTTIYNDHNARIKEEQNHGKH